MCSSFPAKGDNISLFLFSVPPLTEDYLDSYHSIDRSVAVIQLAQSAANERKTTTQTPKHDVAEDDEGTDDEDDDDDDDVEDWSKVESKPATPGGHG